MYPQFYNEYKFALDILLILKEYLKNRDEKSALNNIDKIIQKFGTYKNLHYYMLLTKYKVKDILIHIYSFFHRDPEYFEYFCDVKLDEKDDLTDPETLENLFCGKAITKAELNIHKYYMPIINNFEKTLEKQNIINKSQEKFIKDQEKTIKEQGETLKELKTNIDELYKFKEETKKKLDQIYLRDTIKYSIKYIYRIIFSKFSNEFKFTFENNIYEEIKQLKQILSKKELSKFDFLKEFISAIEFADLSSLNRISHPSNIDRKLEDITNYVDNKKQYLNNVVDFLKNLPDIYDYINLEINLYFCKDRLEEQIKQKFNFEKIYEKIISL